MAVNQGEDIRALQSGQPQNERVQALLNRDAQVFYHQSLSTPVFNTVTGVDGAYLIDGHGRRLLDLHGNGVHTVGYHHPRVLSAMKAQLESGLSFAPRRFTNDPAVQLAEKMVDITPDGLERVLFCPGGSEAIEMAVMLAKHVSGRWKTISYAGTFHGAGFQAISIGADPHFQEGLGPMMPGALHLELPDYYRNPWGFEDQDQIDEAYLQQARAQIAANPDVAAWITEPIFYNSTVPTKTYWQRVQQICQDHGIKLIFDEIYTAFGRTGKMFACEHFVTPDMLVVGKGFGGGVVPFAGIIGRQELNVLQHRSIGHFTHEKSPICSAVAKAVIHTVEEEKLVEHAARLGTYFREELLALQEEFSLIGQVTGLGLNLALDLVKDRKTKERATEAAHHVMNSCLQRGVSFKLIQGNILNLKPALIITRDEIDQIVDAIRAGLASWR
ncbi:aspartate aminotransferase family protein [Pontibacter sp. G13]|uniref:(R)-1-hydroxy-2-aminoethylphosphonate ammonia-lyase n=1 Tax=Pontibacter sp. G13 TaxID=3074898 RepID=UPI00288B2F25|nr:aspartate aminotransferase family protein [Pontibacter sp. G13]WNJ20114.1 aspartate aminotransferase family protein [Pontibacter sp. G13]